MREAGKTPLRKRFEAKGFAVKAYAKAHGLRDDILSRILSGMFDGRRNRKGSGVRKAILQLKKDGVWTEPLAWEEDAA